MYYSKCYFIFFFQNVEVEHSWAFEQLAAQLGPMFKSSYNLLRVFSIITCIIIYSSWYTQVAVETVTTVRPEKLVENNEEEMEGMEIFQKGYTKSSLRTSLILSFFFI